jgi:hypothetical protein
MQQERRERGPKPDNTPTVSVLPAVNEARLLMPDIDRLQDIAYEGLAAEPGEYARSQDEKYPAWSVTHSYRFVANMPIEACWKVNWQNVAQLYIYHSLTHEELARFTGTPLRSIAGHSSKYGWTQARRTNKHLRETDSTPDLKDMEESVRKERIAEFLTQSGFEVARHAMQALLQNVDKVSPRDVPALLQAASKILSMGTGMPESYRHSRVENPLAAQAQQLTTNNILNISGEKAEELLESLRQRAKVLEDARMLPAKTHASPSGH